jgi:hypothetical protein
MSQLVVDNSVVVKWFVVEPYSAEGRRILTDYQHLDCLRCPARGRLSRNASAGARNDLDGRMLCEPRGKGRGIRSSNIAIGCWRARSTMIVP